MIETAVILAAGRGTRLQEVTSQRSKAMVPVAGKPMIQRVIDQLASAGISRYVIVAAPMDSELRRYFAGRSEVQILEQTLPRGSADALRVCEGVVTGGFIVSACDSLVSASDIRAICDFHLNFSPKATVGILRVRADTSLAARSVVAVAGNLIERLVEKPSPNERISNLMALPLYVFKDDIFAELGAVALSVRGEYELPALISQWCDSGEIVGGVEVAERCDLTTISDLLALNIRFLELYHPGVEIDLSAKIEASVQLIPPVMIGPECRIGSGSVIGPAVYLEERVAVANDSRIQHMVGLRGANLSGQCFNQVDPGNRII